MKLLLIDGNSLFHRAYHALPPITDKSGEIANAVFGFSNMLIKAINEVKPTHVACAFDTQAPTFRHVEFEKYKAQRVAPPPDLYPQLPKVKKVLDAFGIKYFEKEGYEADDILATMASKAIGLSKAHPRGVLRSRLAHPGGDTSVQVVILSGDRDVLQLVDGNIKVQQPGWNLKEVTLIGAKEVREKYGLEPHQMVDYKSLTGDPSDNVPGVSGIGPKTAAQLLQKFHTLENLFKHIKETSGTIRPKLEAGRDIALAAKRLVELDKNVDLPASPAKRGERFKIDDLRFEPDWEKVRQEYERLGFKSITAKIEGLSSTPGVESSRKAENTPGVSKADKQKNSSDQLELI